MEECDLFFDSCSKGFLITSTRWCSKERIALIHNVQDEFTIIQVETDVVGCINLDSVEIVFVSGSYDICKRKFNKLKSANKEIKYYIPNFW